MKKTSAIILALVLAVTVIAILFFKDKNPQCSPSQADTAKVDGTPSTDASIPVSSSSSSESTPVASSSSIKPHQAAVHPVSWTEVPKGSPVIKHTMGLSLVGDHTAALVQYDNTYHELDPNQVGEFEKILIAPNSTLHISLAYPQGNPGDVVNLEVEDGGSLNGKGISSVVTVGDDRQIHFDFTATTQEGIYRVVARNGGDTNMLNFWVNPKS